MWELTLNDLTPLWHFKLICSIWLTVWQRTDIKTKIWQLWNWLVSVSCGWESVAGTLDWILDQYQVKPYNQKHQIWNFKRHPVPVSFSSYVFVQSHSNLIHGERKHVNRAAVLSSADRIYHLETLNSIGTLEFLKISNYSTLQYTTLHSLHSTQQ